MSGYDQSLLADAPKASKQERQEGYNVDLLETGRPGGSPPPAALSPIPAHQSSMGHQPYYGQKEAYNGGYNDTARASSKKAPLWRTTKGKILIAVLIIVIIGAVVGGAVGGSVGKKKKGSSSTSLTGTGNSDGSGNSDQSGGENQAGADPSATHTSTTTRSGAPVGAGSATGSATGSPITTIPAAATSTPNIVTIPQVTSSTGGDTA